MRSDRHKEYRRVYMRNRRAEHREEYNAWHNKRIAEYKEEFIAKKRKRQAEDLNQNGVTKSNIRVRSRRILENCHAKLHSYEIHHCFGYESPDKFIYVPRSLHLQIHQLLRDNKIPADSDHWFAIRDLVNSCEEYTYIRA